MERIRIDVSQKDINCGKKGSLSMCPIGHAARRAGIKRVNVDGHIIASSTNGHGRTKTYLLPEVARKFVRKFDKDGRSAVKPISFTIQREDIDEGPFYV